MSILAVIPLSSAMATHSDAIAALFFIAAGIVSVAWIASRRHGRQRATSAEGAVTSSSASLREASGPLQPTFSVLTSDADAVGKADADVGQRVGVDSSQRDTGQEESANADQRTATHVGQGVASHHVQRATLEVSSRSAPLEIEPAPVAVSSIDDELLSRVMATIEAHLCDSSYSVAELSRDVGLTRGHLYKRMVALTGRAPLDLIHHLRLKRGKSLLEQGRTNVSEVAYSVGLSAKRFTHYFKQTYGQTPTDYLRSLRK